MALAAAEREPGVRPFLERAVDDYRNGWSIGTFGVIGEFVYGPEEATEKSRTSGGGLQIVTARGGLRIAPHDDLHAVAYDTLVGDGETWEMPSRSACRWRPRKPGRAFVASAPIGKRSAPRIVTQFSSTSASVLGT